MSIQDDYDNFNSILRSPPFKYEKMEEQTEPLKMRTLDEVKLEIYTIENARRTIDERIDSLIAKINKLPINRKYKDLYVDLVTLGENHRKCSDEICTLHSELARIQIYLYKVGEQSKLKF